MRTLVIGSGAREHALVHALVADAAVSAVLVAPGNPGIAELAATYDIDPCDPLAVRDLAITHACDLVVVGPETPLVAGVADAVREAGILCFGPGAEAARLEASKSFAKEIMAAAEVPTARSYLCTTPDDAAAALDAFGPPFVVKDDGLAHGKGVVVTLERGDALAHAETCLVRPGSEDAEVAPVVIEQFLDGPEVSLFCLCDGYSAMPLLAAQDFKRLADDGQGPNTGGMGSYSPLPWAREELAEEVVAKVAQPVVDEMARRGTPFIGVLYCGLALSSQGLRVIEFNARFGDPETQGLLALFDGSLGSLLHAAARGELHTAAEPRWHPGAAVTVVLAAHGYPVAPRSGDVITGIEAAEEVPGVHVLHAGTARDDDGALRSCRGRVLSVVGRGSDLDTAREAAYRAMSHIELAGSQFRSDIALASQRPTS